MKFTETALGGAFIVELDRKEDERGFFARTYCREEFGEHGLVTDLVQSSVSYNARRGTLRGMHYQSAPYSEAKLVRCTKGAIYDVIIDLREGSPTFKKWLSIELTAENRLTLYIPREFAHGFQTLTDEAEVFYQMSDYYRPEHARGVRWNDPAFNIRWPIPAPIMSERDRHYADFRG